ncbi:ATP-binding cassette sub-family C member 4-like [Brevipalpus obovatus]|uniref:ATP-binding cassette sub-family C member 4-like n=1 Tax=Brevipalpus obovatus TaxID=246614 RepID=UPI003D9FB06F
MLTDSKIEKLWPADSASFLSKIFFTWTLPLFKRGLGKELDYNDLYQCSKDEDCTLACEKLKKEWQKELKKKKPSLFWAVLKAFGLDYLKLIFSLGSYEELVISITQTYFMGAILDHLAGTLEKYALAYASLFGFCFCSLSWIITHHPFYVQLLRYSTRVRIAIQKLVMEKLLVVNTSALHGSSGGQIINLVSNDVAKIDTVSVLITDMIIAPFQTAIVSIILWKMLNVAYLVGLGIILIFVAFQSLMGKKFGYVRQSTAEFTDKRIRLMNQIISGMKVIKMYSWERPFADMIGQIRRNEISRIRTACFLKAINLALSFITTRIILFSVLLTYIWLGNLPTARVVFVTMALLNVIRGTVTTYFPQAVAALAEFKVSCGRIQKFLELQEVPKITETEVTKSKFILGEDLEITVRDLNSYWDPELKDPCLENINFTLKGGELLTVVGPVGSGKSSLLLSLLRETPTKSSEMNLKGIISYASQEPWIMNTTVRDNILFGLPYDEERYQEVISVTGLNRDLKILHYADMTMAGERGVALSGGQRARVGLARAIYHEADIYLLDDPLSAVDAAVAKRIFEKCIKQYLRSKIVILVTHQIHFLKNSDKILALDRGKGKLFANFKEFQTSGPDMKSIFSKKEPDEKLNLPPSEMRRISTVSAKSRASIVSAILDNTLEDEHPTLAEESRKSGSVTGKTYWLYFKSGAGVTLGLLVLGSNVLSQLMFSANDIWLASWTNQLSSISLLNKSDTGAMALENHSLFNIDPLDLTSNMIIYTLLIIALFAATMARSTLFFHMCSRSSVRLHDSIFYQLLRAPMQVFEENPLGRILNRFSRDLGIVDEVLPLTAFDQIMNVMVFVGVLIVVAMVAWQMIVVAVLLIIVIIVLREIYIPTARSVKRIESAARSPVYSTITNTADGLATIRAFQMEYIFEKNFVQELNDHSATWMIFIYVSRSFGLWIDWITFVYMIATAIFIYISSDVIPAGSAGLALSQILMLTNTLQWTVRQSAEFESQMTSVERILEYTELPHEADLVSAVRPSQSWPREGAIRFNRVFLQYPSSPIPSLVNININIKSGEKVGVVGRTGAGKSSLLSCLFRLVEPSGVIEIDKIDIKDIGLEDLRRKISIIPQDPVIFAGTVRNNLDPFREHDDADIWTALGDVQLKQKITELEGQLEFEIREGGENFSVGQRQLICLARALLRNNKILVIDEATANVDTETDQLIQQTIRRKFDKCTVITIAHRLNTVIDSDRILVLDAGRVIEFDTPYQLLQNKSSLFSKLIEQTGKSMANKLHTLVKENHERSSSETESDEIIPNKM